MSADVAVEPLWTRGYVTTLALVFPAMVPLDFLADRWQMGAVFFPGPFAGYVAAHLVGAVLVARWQRRHGAVVIDLPHGDGGARLYARAGAPSAEPIGRERPRSTGLLDQHARRFGERQDTTGSLTSVTASEDARRGRGPAHGRAASGTPRAVATLTAGRPLGRRPKPSPRGRVRDHAVSSPRPGRASW